MASGIAIQADGKIIVAGFSGSSRSAGSFAVVRYETTGALDTSFDGDGKVVIDMGNFSSANDIVIQRDGKIVVVGASGVVGSSNYAFAVARLNSDGSLDASFDGDGRVITSLGSYSYTGAVAVALQTDGKIITAGHSGSAYSTADFALVRYNADGSLDASFDGDGKVITAVSSSFDGAFAVAVQTDGKIVAAGSSQGNMMAVVRYNINGSLDTSFDGDGIVLTPGIDRVDDRDYAPSVVIQSNGKIVVSGSIKADFALVRYNPNGSLDTSFGGDGIVTTNFNQPSWGAGVGGLAIQPDGKILAAGYCGDPFESFFIAVARYIGDPLNPVANHLVSGRVMTPDGRGLRNATVSITDSSGISRVTTTSSFGFFTFENVTTGGTYTFSVSSRLYRFAPRTLQVNDNLTLADFVGLE